MKSFELAAAGAALSCICAVPVAADEGRSLFGLDAPAVTYGKYVRFELGGALSATDSGDWLPPGNGDPRVFFALDGEDSIAGSAALGFDWMNGFRAELALTHVGAEDVAGDWSRTDPASPGPHASVEATIRSTAVMGNLYWLPLQAPGRNAKFQPFVTGGLGLSVNEMDDWTRINAASNQPERSFEGGSKTDFAWNLGLGASYQVTPTGSRPVLLEASYRYYDLGRAEGGAQPLPGSGSEQPREPLSVERESHVIAIGLRIPLR